jgi:TRAP-type C4-dicarboxylate transport system substrate-binding protein
MRHAKFVAIVVALALGALAVRAAMAKEITLIFATTSPPQSYTNRLQLHPWADAVNARGAGILHLDVRDGGAIADHTNFYSRVLDDVVQISFGSESYVGGKFPRSEVVSLPFGAENSADGSQVFWQLYASGVLNAEYDEIQPLALFQFPQQPLHFAKRLSSTDALRGLKIIVSDKVAGEVVTALGATPLSINAQDVYSSLQRGSVQGVMFPWPALQPFKLAEVTSYHIDTTLGGAPGMVFMSKKKYLALPPEARKVLDETGGELASRTMGLTLDRQAKDVLGQVKADPKQTVVELTAAQTSEWRQKTQTVIDRWLRETPNGAAVLAEYRKLLAKLEPRS